MKLFLLLLLITVNAFAYTPVGGFRGATFRPVYSRPSFVRPAPTLYRAPTPVYRSTSTFRPATVSRPVVSSYHSSPAHTSFNGFWVPYMVGRTAGRSIPASCKCVDGKPVNCGQDVDCKRP